LAAQPFDDAGAATGPPGTFPVRAVFALTEACFLGLLVGACFGGSLVTTTCFCFAQRLR
jgi:hypothetical protein